MHISEILPIPIAEGDFAETVVGQAVTIDVLANDDHEQDGTAMHVVFSAVLIMQPYCVILIRTTRLMFWYLRRTPVLRVQRLSLM